MSAYLPLLLFLRMMRMRVQANAINRRLEEDADNDNDEHDDNIMQLMLLLAALIVRRNRHTIHIRSRNRKAFHQSLSPRLRRLRDRRIPRIALQNPGESSWR